MNQEEKQVTDGRSEGPSGDLGYQIDRLMSVLRQHIGAHRQLLEIVREERQAFVDLEMRVVQEKALSKQGLMEMVRLIEIERQEVVKTLAAIFGLPEHELKLSRIILETQGRDLKRAEQLQSLFNALNVLIQRVQEQNASNLEFVQQSLSHLDKMKRNVLGEASSKSNVYSPTGQKVGQSSGARFLSKEI